MLNRSAAGSWTYNFHADGVPDERLHSLGPPEAYECAEFTKSLTLILSNPDAAVFVAGVGGR